MLINKSDIIRRLADKLNQSNPELGVNQESSAIILDTFIKIINEELSKNNIVNIKNFGKFFTYERYSRSFTNPSTKELVMIANKLRPKFKFSGNFNIDRSENEN